MLGQGSAEHTVSTERTTVPAGNFPAQGEVTLHHVALYVADLEATKGFYVGALGMHELDRPADFTFPGAYFRIGTAEVHVVVETETGRSEALRPRWSGEELRTGYTVHFALGVSDLEPILDRLRQQGATIVGGPRIRADGVEQWYVADPDGYVVELICLLDEATADRRRRELAESGEGVPVAPGR
jgi:catechol 2,3-dioxygenase-like lactoylglutathione lyase family enzyme